MQNDLRAQIETTAFAFRGYNITNLGRSRELLLHPAYGPIVERHLKGASRICRDATGRRADLVRRVRRNQETSLRSYPEAIALILAMEMAQIEILRDLFGVPYHRARMAFGYSLGEMAALAAGGTFPVESAMRVLLALAPDCAELAGDVTMGVLFSRGPALDVAAVERLCLHLNTEGRGVIGVSALLSPNSVLLLGQQDTVDRFAERMHDALPRPAHLRKNPHRWPPMHTPVVWQRAIPNRSAVMMHTMEGGFRQPKPNVLSLVTGQMSYNDHNCREIIARWVDHPQRLWDAVCGTLSARVDTIVHVGPEPNLVPATFERIAANVRAATGDRSLTGLGLRAVSNVARRTWLRNILPSRAALLRAAHVRHVILEDWLLEQAVEPRCAASVVPPQGTRLDPAP